MKGKFITGILTLAVCLGLLLVPAMGVSVSAGEPGAGQATLLLPAEVKVTPGEAFAVDVTIYNPDAIAIYSAASDMVWSTPSMLGVTGIDWGVWPTQIASGWDNATGEVYCTEGGSTGSPSISTTTIAHCTVHFVAGSSEGTVTLSFIPSMTDESVIYDVLTEDILDWSAMQNLTVKIGTPKLTVDVSPAGKGDVKIAGVIPGAYPDVSNRSWDAAVSLEAVDSVAGWAFDSWSGDVVGSANPDSVTMDALTKSVTANFVELPCDLDVDPNSLDFSARYGSDTDSDTVTISNIGGGLLGWTIGCPPSWSVGDTWTYWNTYDTLPDGTPYPSPYYNSSFCPLNDTALTLTVVGETSCAYIGFADWPMGDPQRSINGGMPTCLTDATVMVNKCSLDYIQQIANITVMGFPTSALVTWAYDGCHGWPYYLGKAWTYNITVVDLTGTHTTAAYAMVTAGPVANPMGAETDCYVITHSLTPDPAVGTFMQQYWSDTARNFVFQWDGGTFDAPPVDMRILTGSAIAGLPGPTCCDAPSWLSFDKVAGSLGIGGSELLTVTADTTGLAVGDYSGSFCISGCCCLGCSGVQYECVDVSLEVLPATTIDVIRNLPADALDMDAEYPGDMFDVYVNFTASVDEFNSIGLTDLAPAGWDVQTDIAWCSPVATWTMSPGNKAEYAWSGPFVEGTVFSARYTVTIPATAKNGLNDWPNNDGSKAWAEYWFGAAGPYTSAVTGDFQKIVTIPGPVVGETRDVNADLLTTTLVVLSEEVAVYEDEDSSTAPDALYEVWADDTGLYWMEASKYCYFSLDTNTMPTPRNPLHALDIDFGTTAKLYAGYTLDFEGDYGLVPKACTMSYAMKSVNHWLFVPIDGSLVSHSEWQLSVWKAMESVHSWQFPCGCNT